MMPDIMGEADCPGCGETYLLDDEKDVREALRHVSGHIIELKEAALFLEMLQDCDVNDSVPNLNKNERQHLIELMGELDD